MGQGADASRGGSSSSTPCAKATRLGVDIGLFNSPGWSQSGGPWVKPDQAMRYVVLPETRLRGPQRFEGKLPAPAGDFQDIAVLAFPAPAGEGERGARITARTPTAVTFEMPAPFTARSVTVQPVKAGERHGRAAGVGRRPAVPDGEEVRDRPAQPGRQRRAGAAGAGRGVVSGHDGAVLPADVSRPTASWARSDSRRRRAWRAIAEKSLVKVFQDPLPPFDFYTWPPPAEPESAGPGGRAGRRARPQQADGRRRHVALGRAGGRVDRAARGA